MPATKRIALGAIAALAFLALLAGCNVRVKDDQGNGQAKKVDIETPAGSIHVRTAADIADTGLKAYPGAQAVKKDSHENESANVSLEGPNGEGLRIVVLHYQSSDAPDKVLGFYRDELKQYGAVTECKGNLDYNVSNGQKSAVCKPNGSGEIALSAGTGEDNQRIVNVKPKGSGSEFDVVYLRAHGKRGTV